MYTILTFAYHDIFACCCSTKYCNISHFFVHTSRSTHFTAAVCTKWDNMHRRIKLPSCAYTARATDKSSPCSRHITASVFLHDCSYTLSHGT